MTFCSSVSSEVRTFRKRSNLAPLWPSRLKINELGVRTTQVLSIEEAINRFLMTKAKASQYHSNDLSRRLKRWAETTDQNQPIHAVTKQEIETYLAQYSAQNFVNHRAALSNLFGYAVKVGAAPGNPLSTIEKPRIKRSRPAILSSMEFETLLNRALSQSRFDVLSWLVLGGLVGLRPYEVLRLEWTGIQFQTREVRIEAEWTKTHRARVIPLQPNALEWLKLIAAHTLEKTLRIMPSESTWNNRWRRWRQEEETPLPLAWWDGKDDVLRHSYGTYRAAILRNSHVEAAGLSPDLKTEPKMFDLFCALAERWGPALRYRTKSYRAGEALQLYNELQELYQFLRELTP
jgi:integrase